MFFVLSRARDKEKKKILSPHKESNLRPSDSADFFFFQFFFSPSITIMAQRSWCLIEQYFLTDLTSRFTYNFIWERLFKGGDGRNSGWRGEGGDGLLQI